jgi:hypothetical protein
MRAQEAFDEFVRDGVWPFLRGQGFKRSAATFHRADGANWQVINLQKSAYSAAAAVRFTANLGVAFDRLRDGVHDWPAGKRPAESRCHLRVRLGLLLSGEDTWWRLTPDSNLEAFTDTINTALANYAFPWLETRSDERRLIELMQDRDQLEGQRYDFLYWLARLANEHGELDLALRAEAVRAKKGAEIDRMRRVAPPL